MSFLFVILCRLLEECHRPYFQRAPSIVWNIPKKSMRLSRLSRSQSRWSAVQWKVLTRLTLVACCWLQISQIDRWRKVAFIQQSLNVFKQHILTFPDNEDDWKANLACPRNGDSNVQSMECTQRPLNSFDHNATQQNAHFILVKGLVSMPLLRTG